MFILYLRTVTSVNAFIVVCWRALSCTSLLLCTCANNSHAETAKHLTHRITAT